MARKTPKKRADLLLVDRGLAESREKAQAFIMEGLVYTPAGKVLKPGLSVATDTPLEVKERSSYVSRGGIKLAHALDRFRLDVSGKVALDVGASTGGFTDCLLRRGAHRVFAVDVGHGQLDYRLRQDPRVLSMEGVNAHYPFILPSSVEENGGVEEAVPGTGPSHISEKVGLATIDVSFISITKVIPSVAQHVVEGDLIVGLIKPSFEALRNEVSRGGVIKDPKVHAKVLARVILWVVNAGFRLRDLTPSPILGDAGNREFFLLLQK